MIRMSGRPSRPGKSCGGKETDMTLKDLTEGKKGTIVRVGGDGALRQHLLDMGLTPGTEVSVVKLAPLGDPMEIRVRGYALTLRLAEAAEIGLGQNASESEKEPVLLRGDRKGKAEHPGLGEEGRFHPPGSGEALPDDTLLTFGLLGNQNSGKTTLFNQLTGANQHVGNFPGVTVDRKDGVIRGFPNTRITDLPGIYSMSPYSGEELVSRDFVMHEKPHGIINIVDATNLERNLYLTLQLLEMETPMVVALNMMDEVSGNGGSVDINRMEELLGVPVVPIAAIRNQGVDELIKHAVHVAKYQEKPLRQDPCDENYAGGSVHRCLHAAAHLIEDHAKAAGIPVRFAASKLIEGDQRILEQLELDENEQELLEHIAVQMEAERGLDRSAAMADMRYSAISRIASECLVKPHESREQVRSRKLDRVLTGKFTAIPIFIGLMALSFFLTFHVIGAFFQDLLEKGIGALSGAVDGWLTAANVNETIHSLIIGGIFQGVGSVLSFLPIIVTMFFFLSLMEDSGYIARVAFVMDKLLRKIGLSGRSIVPLLIGFGCTVPAVMSTRTLPSERDRRMTILLTPFMSCTAKLPIYTFFTAAFFPKNGWLVMTGLYVLGIVAGILVALLYKKTLFKGEAVPFVMELPSYRLPSPRNVLQLLWQKCKDFVQRAFSVILIATIVVWFLQSLDLSLNLVTDSERSILAMIAGFLAPLFKPLGLGDWRIATSLISGFMAKESVVSVLEVLFGTEGGIALALTKLQAASMLVFSLLYTPCVAAVSAIRREMGRKWAVGVVLWQCGVAWLAALAVRLVGLLFGAG